MATNPESFTEEPEVGFYPSPDLHLAVKAVAKVVGIDKREADKDFITPLDEDVEDLPAYRTVEDMLDREPTEEELAKEEEFIFDEEPERGSLYTEAVDQFMSKAGKFPILTRTQEVSAAKAIQKGKRAQALLDAAEADHQSNVQALRDDITKGHDAKELMINSNYRLVLSIVRRYMNRGVDLADLIQEGNIGLNRAVEKFDWQKGYKLSTYSTWWIKQAAQRAVANQAKTIRMPVHIYDRMLDIHKTENNFFAEHDRFPTNEEIAEATGIPIDKIAETKAVRDMQPVSLNRLVGDDGDIEFGDVYDFSSNRNPDSVVDTALDAEKQVIASQLAEAIDLLPPRQAEIIKLRYGIGNEEPQTLESIGKQLSITRERVRQIEQDGLKRLADNAKLAGF